jgi:uncharacterized membrane protein YhhN
MRDLLRNTSLIFGVLYFLAAGYPFPGSIAVKGLSIALLAVLALVRGFPLLALALAVSSVGDVLLDLDPKGLFVAGLSAFLTAHIIYTVLFARAWKRFRWAVIPVVLYALAFSIWLAPRLGPLTVPVSLYICVITAMASAAICSRLPLWVPIGALLFLASDSLLAAAKFAGPFPLRDYLVWGTYYAAQFSIAAGVLLSASLTDNKPHNTVRVRAVGRS